MLPLLTYCLLEAISSTQSGFASSGKCPSDCIVNLCTSLKFFQSQAPPGEDAIFPQHQTS